MYYYLLFVLVMPALVYVDYLCYKKRMEKLIQAQPDYETNRAHYNLLLQRLYSGQKRTSTVVCAVLCLMTLILGTVFLFSTAQAA